MLHGPEINLVLSVSGFANTSAEDKASIYGAKASKNFITGTYGRLR